MKIARLSSPSFCAEARYSNYNADFHGEPALSIEAREIISQVDNLPDGYFYEVSRQGQNYRFSPHEPVNSLDTVGIEIRNDDGDVVVPRVEIYHHRDLGDSMDLEWDSRASQLRKRNFGELEDPSDISASLRKLVQKMRSQFEINLINKKLRQGIENLNNVELADVIGQLSRLLKMRLLEATRKAQTLL